MGTPEFPDLGRHCSFPDCNILDFLPFTCDACHQVFCLEHRSYTKHHCEHPSENGVTVLVCPICAKAVRLVPNEDPNLTWDQHVRTNCDPSNYAKVQRKPRCPVRGCKESLTFSNKMVCKDCKQEVCLKHRFGPDHDCKGQVKVGKKGTSFADRFVQSFRERASIGSGQGTSSLAGAAQTGWQSASSTIRASAEAGMTKLNTFTTSMLNAVGGTSNKNQSEKDIKTGQGAKAIRPPMSAGSKEVCPQCRAQFPTVSLLIQHVETSHSTGKALISQEIVDLCPKCGKDFQDPISLVNHVERDHGGTSMNSLKN